MADLTGMDTSGSDAQAWLLTLASALACILGSFFICFDLLIRCLPGKQDFSFQKDKRFLVGSLSFGSGVLLFTALNRILPEGLEYLQFEDDKGKMLLKKKSYADGVLMLSFIAGVVCCIVLNTILHRLTPQSIIHCGDEDEAHHGHETSEHSNGNHAQSDGHAHHADAEHGNSENSPLLRQSMTKRQQRSISFLKRCRHEGNSQCAGFTDPCPSDEVCCAHKKNASSDVEPSVRRYPSCKSFRSSKSTNREPSEHHHHVTEEQHDLLRIGFQTATAITLHKVPEGFIMFMANHRDSSLGFNIFLALGIHNIVEGFTIAFPLYLAWQSRTKAILVAVGLGGLSQPLGALLAYALTRTKFGQVEATPGLDLAYGILFGATAGFMCVIAVSSMLPQAIRNDAHDGFLFTLCFFLGTAVIGVSGAFTK